MEPIAAIVLGLAGGLHCLGMCGPIAMALPAQRSVKMYFGRVFYQFGRILTYTILGALAGAGASTVSLVATQQIVSVVAGSLMIVAAVLQLALHRSIIPSVPLMRLTAPVRTRLQHLIHHNTVAAFAGIGMLNGLLPCGLVIAALLGAASVGTTQGGASFMAFFGVGTLPVMTAVWFGSGYLTSRMRGTLRKVVPVVGVMLGVLLVIRGMGLGIPLVSPQHRHYSDNSCCTPAER